MKKFYSFLFAAVALVGFAACNSDSTEEPAPAQENVGKMEFTANVDEATKTYLDGVSVKWHDDDVIGVNNKSYTIKKGTNKGTTATLVGEDPVEAPYVAVYPLSAFNYYNNEQEFINITLDANVAAGTFADGANIALAFSDDTNLSFKNLLSVLKFQVAAECETVTISSENPLVGTVNFGYDHLYKGASTYETSIELTIDGGFKTSTTYYTTIIPGIHKFTVLTDGKPSREAKAGTTLYRNQVVDLGTLPVNYRVYVEDDSEYSNLYLYLFDDKGNNTWPGAQLTKTENINGVDYKYFDVPAEMVGKTYTYIFNNGEKSQVEEGKKLTFNKDNYLWLTKKYTQNIDASNKGKTDPYTIYALQWDWNDWTDICCYMWINGGATNATWPGKSMTAMGTNTKYNDKSYYYWEVTTDFAGKSNVNFIINGMKDGNRKQTNDIKNKSITKNYYVKLSGNDGGANFTCQEEAF